METKPMFTRRHYKEVARVLREFQNTSVSLLHVEELAKLFAEAFEKDNPKFKGLFFVNVTTDLAVTIPDPIPAMESWYVHES